MKPAANFTLTPEERHQFYKFIKLVKFPDSFASNLTKNITNNDNKIAGLKSHDCHVIMQHLLLLGIQPFLKKPIITTISEMSTFLKQLCVQTLNVSEL